MSNLTKRLTTSTTVEGLVQLAHTMGRTKGFSRLRFYEYLSNEARIVSRASVGHEPEWADKFRRGLVSKTLKDFPLEKRESFWCFHTGSPVAVILQKYRQEGPLKAKILGDIQSIVLTSQDLLNEPLPFEEDEGIRFHFPLSACGQFVGKLCFDSTFKELSVGIPPLISEFWNELAPIAPYFEILLRRERYPQPVSDSSGFQRNKRIPFRMRSSRSSLNWQRIRDSVARRIQRMQTVSELLDFIVGEVPQRHFGCRYASIFLLSEDGFGSKKLVLRRTSFLKLKSEENSAAYELDAPRGLTPWVARNREPLRLADLNLLADQLNTSNRRPLFPSGGCIWANCFQDSETHNSFLAVPMLNETGDLLGVLRLTEKTKLNDYFSESDQIRLKLLVDELFSPRLTQLAEAGRFEFTLSRLPKVVRLAVDEGVTPKRRLAEALTDILNESIPEKYGKKCYLVNKLSLDGKTFTIDHLGGSLAFSHKPHELVYLDGTLTNLLLRPSQRGAVYIQDFKAAGVADSIHPRCKGVVSALGCRISFERKDYAALIVLSDKFDLSRRDARLLELICLLAGGIRARRDLVSFELTDMGLGHDFATQLDSVRIELQRLADTAPEARWTQCMESPAGQVEFAISLLNAYLPRVVDPEFVANNALLSHPLFFIAANATRAAESATGRRGILINRIDPSIRARLWEDPINAILFNLLRNALWNSADSGVVTIDAAAQERYVTFCIANNGPALPVEVKEQLNYSPVDIFQSRSKHYVGGTGYGLYLAKRLASAYSLPDGRCATIGFKGRVLRENTPTTRLFVKIPTNEP